MDDKRKIDRYKVKQGKKKNLRDFDKKIKLYSKGRKQKYVYTKDG